MILLIHWLALTVRRQLFHCSSANANLRWGSESAVDASAIQLTPDQASDQVANQVANQVVNQFGDIFGNVWQWAEDHFYPLDGFAVHRLYDDFSLPCF